MAAKRSLSVELHSGSHGFMTVLSLAVCEWVLIFFLFINATFSYLLTKFAQYCELQAPCPLCSRLDHIVGGEKTNSYENLLCCNHRSEISSLVTCHIHGKLAHIHGMCENCLFSLATNDKSNSETYRLLVGKLGLNLECISLQSPLLKPDSTSPSSCSCCKKPRRSMHVTRVSQLDSLKKIRGKVSRSMATNRPRNFDPSSRVGYTKLKLTSDSESEFRFSDDDGGGNYLVSDKTDTDEDFSVPRDSKIKPQMLPDELDPGNVTNKKTDTLVPLLSPRPDGSMEYYLRELCWPEAEQTSNLPAICELIPLDDISLSSSFVEHGFHFPDKLDPSELSDLNTIDAFARSFNTVQVSRASPENSADPTKSNGSGQATIAWHEELTESTIPTSGEVSKADQVSNDHFILSPNHMDPREGFLAEQDTTKDYTSEGFLAERDTIKDSTSVDEDLKPWASYNTSPSVELHRADAASTSKWASTEPSESGFESLDGSIISEIEGETVMDRLKRQVEHGRRYMSALYKELEEERSASSIAVNEAMAMITRLQEEKAAVHTEALQYLRMMEEQAEYDVDALEKANDLLAEKEKEIQDLEAELEFYRQNGPDETMIQDTLETNTKHFTPKSSLGFEDEKLYISQCLKKLEMKIHQFSQNGDTPNDVYCENLCNGSIEKPSTTCREIDLVAFENEISNINRRLEKLEADSDFLTHTYTSLQNGTEGLEFIRGIAHQLQELRKIGVRERSNSVT